jgi:hypothetical protein
MSIPEKKIFRGRGAPKGHVGNPTGANQWVARKGEGAFPKMFAVRISEETWLQMQRLPAPVRARAVREWIDRGLAEFDFEDEPLARRLDAGE